ncbi:hypothetical protein [Phaeospirillum tilakii]|uniref:Uncharacterized protein n=1 Tax=Phaeospirillum tilakii TaxID=741673 RepID=A0ABW5CA53_9PROT
MWSPILLNGLSEPSGGVVDLLLALEAAGKIGGCPVHQLRLVIPDEGAGGILGHAAGFEAGDQTDRSEIVAQGVGGGVGAGVFGDEEAKHGGSARSCSSRRNKIKAFRRTPAEAPAPASNKGNVMRVDESTRNDGFAPSSSRRSGGAGPSFGEVLSAVQGQTGTSETTTSNGVSGSAAASASGKSSSISDPEQYFRDYMSKTPEQRMFDAFLAQNHVSKAQYAAMSSEEQAKLKAKFQEYVKEKAEEKLGLGGLAGGGEA